MRFTLTRVGVLLAGCGAHDGTDTAEAVLTFLELERAGVAACPLVPPGDQMHVIDHASGCEVEGASREMTAEAARLTRGRVEPLGESPTGRLHGLIVPGGGGIPKNLMTAFLQPGARRELLPGVFDLLSHCLTRGKPVGMLGMANFLLDGLVDSPVLPARAGARPEPLVVDPEHRLVYAPGFLATDSIAEVAESVRGLVELVLHYAAEARSRGEHSA